jgi:type IV pilus assembly protein PilZ
MDSQTTPLDTPLTNLGSARPSVLSLAIKERAGLYASYMPFIENGGLFIPTQKDYAMGDVLYIILQLMSNPKKFSISAKVVWVSPVGMSQKPQGIGVQIPYDASGNDLRQFIEQALGTALGSSRKTNTL